MQQQTQVKGKLMSSHVGEKSSLKVQWSKKTTSFISLNKASAGLASKSSLTTSQTPLASSETGSAHHTANPVSYGKSNDYLASMAWSLKRSCAGSTISKFLLAHRSVPWNTHRYVYASIIVDNNRGNLLKPLGGSLLWQLISSQGNMCPLAARPWPSSREPMPRSLPSKDRWFPDKESQERTARKRSSDYLSDMLFHITVGTIEQGKAFIFLLINMHLLTLSWSSNRRSMFAILLTSGWADD